MSHELHPSVMAGYEHQSSEQIASTLARYNMGREIAEELNPNIAYWLDIGPNFGYGLKGLYLAKGRIIAADINEEFLKKAVDNNPHIKGVVMDGTNLALQDDTFDVVSAFEVIEHMEEEKQRQLLTEAHRVLKPNGILLISTPNKTASGKKRMNEDHKRELELAELTSILEETGFEVIEILGQSFFRKGNIIHNLFRTARENFLVSYVYNNLLPWSIRRNLRDIFLKQQNSDQVRKPETNETARTLFVTCRKK